MKLLPVILLAVLLGGCACPGESAPPPRPQSMTFGEPKDDRDVPGSRDIITQQRMRDTNATTLEEATRYTPGVTR